MRRLIPILLLTACAQPGRPPGGPPDDKPPQLVSIRPDSNALNVHGGAISFQFDEVVSELPTGARSLPDAFLVSPSHGPLSVSWHRSRIDVTPKGGLRPNQTYTVELLPGMTDLDHNVDSSSFRFVFSTGPTIATGVMRGIVFDWMSAKPAPRATVEAFTLPDSLTWTVRADSTGEFAIAHMPPGSYVLRAYIDQNNNHFLDPRELFDSATVTLGDSLRREMLAIQRDSIGPGILEVTPRDSITLGVTFDRAIDTAMVLSRGLFSLRSGDSTIYPVRTVLTKAQVDKVKADSLRAKAVEDSVHRAAVADSVRQADSTKAAAAPTRPTTRRPGVTIAPPPGPARDTTPRVIPKPSAQIPGREIQLIVQRPLPPTTSFRLTADSIRSVTGAVRSSSRVFTTPRPKVEADTSKAKSDTGAVKSDTGAVKPDTGAVRHDTGATRPDTSVLQPSAGARTPDAGVVRQPPGSARRE